MKLKNRFSNEDKIRVWGDHPYCALCLSNQICSIHHIDGTKSASIYNAIMLCHVHHREADTHNTNSPLSEEFRKRLRMVAFSKVIKSGHVNTIEDEAYLATYPAGLN